MFGITVPGVRDGVEFVAVLDTATDDAAVMIYDARYKGDVPRGARRQDQWTADGQFVAAYDVETIRTWGVTGLNLDGGEDDWTVPAASTALIRTWVNGILRAGDYPTGSASGMGYVGKRYVFTGPQGYRVRPSGRDDGLFNVHSYAGGVTGRVAGSAGLGLTEEDAHAYAARLAVGR